MVEQSNTQRTLGNFSEYYTENNPRFLNFPLEKQDRYKARLKFEPIRIEEVSLINDTSTESLSSEVWQRIKTDVKRLGQSGLDTVTSFISSEDDASENATNPLAEFNNDNNKSGKQYVRRAPIVRSRNYCYLYMPTGIQFNDQVNIRSANIGTSGIATQAALRQRGLPTNISGVANTLGSAFGTALSTVFDIGSSSEAFASLAARAAAGVDVANLGFGENLAAGIQITAQTVANPVTRAIFDNVPLRVFTFQFKFIPMSPRESEEIEKIIYYFRSEMYPEALNYTSTGLPFGFKFPSLFDIRLQYGGGNTVNDSTYRTLPNTHILPSYVINVQHNYNPSSMSWHKGGKPTEVDMSLTFMEYRPLTKQDIKDFHNGKSPYTSEGIQL